jgi:hypothetical protein
MRSWRFGVRVLFFGALEFSLLIKLERECVPSNEASEHEDFPDSISLNGIHSRHWRLVGWQYAESHLTYAYHYTEISLRISMEQTTAFGLLGAFFS